MSRNDKNLTIEGESLKRYRLSYWGSPVGSYDTAREAWESYKTQETIRPFIDRKNQGRYTIRDGDREITSRELKQRADKE